MVAIATAQTQRAKKTTQPKSPPAVSARLERHTVQADCAGCVFVWWQERGPFGTFKTFSKNLLIHYQHLIPPTIFSPIFSPSSFISLHHVFSFDLPLLFYSLLETSELEVFCVFPNLIQAILWLICRSPGSQCELHTPAKRAFLQGRSPCNRSLIFTCFNYDRWSHRTDVQLNA